MALPHPCCALLLLLLAAPAGAQELPKRDRGEAIDLLEPKLMLNDAGDLPLPPRSALDAEPVAALPPDVAKCSADLERARKAAAWRERLWKAGVFSKVEAEEAALKVVRLTKDLELARAAVARAALEELRQKSADAATIAAAEASAATLKATAAEAVAGWAAAQRAAAELRLQRERQLYARGASSRSQVRKAEAALESLAPRPAP